VSAREQAGFRGQLRTCIEVEENQQPTTPEGAAQVPQRARRTTHSFDRAGRLISYQGIDGKSQWLNENLYDADGRFLKSTSSSAGNVYHEVEYVYDHSGRVASYTSKSAEGRITSLCSYDRDGNKIVNTSFDPKILEARRRTVNAGPRLSGLESGIGVPDGGSVRTRYDHEQRPVEAQVLTLDGQVVSRVTLAYDSAGRLVEEKQIMESPESLIPANVRAKMILAGGTLEELRNQLSKFTGGEEGQHVISYVYDAGGRIIERRTRMAPFMEQIVTRTYNSHGDIAEERWVKRGEDSAETDEQDKLLPDRPPAEPKVARLLHSYIYDDHGNWAEHTISQSQGDDGPFLLIATKRRTFTYY
jgi:uncharacterized protein YjhX (UPF0386 family)